MDRMLEEMKGMLRAMKDDPELLALMAACMKKMHHELMNAGFSKQEATRIIASQGLNIKG